MTMLLLHLFLFTHIFLVATQKTREKSLFEDPTRPPRCVFPHLFPRTQRPPQLNEGSFLQLPGKSPDNDALHADVAPELIPAAQNVSSQVGYIGKGWLGEGGSLVELVGDVVFVFC